MRGQIKHCSTEMMNNNANINIPHKLTSLDLNSSDLSTEYHNPAN
jgi:hypothetical protein